MKLKIRDMLVSALFAAVTVVFAQISIPTGNIPFTFSLLAVFVTSMVLGGRRAFWAMFIYIALGAAGLPVFAGFRGGLSVILGPTGGYILSYIIMAPVMGYLAGRERSCGRIKMMLIMLVGLLICYALGTAQFMIIRQTGLLATLSLTVFPFVAFDLVKIIGASVLSFELRKVLKKNNFI